MKLVNRTGQPDNAVFVTIDPGSSAVTLADAGGLQVGFGHGVPLSSLRGPGTDAAKHTYSFTTTGTFASARLYYSFGDQLRSSPSATSEPLRYDYAELTTDGDGFFNGDLSAVDQVGIPASLSLLDANGNVMRSGPSEATRKIGCINDIVDRLKANAPTGWDANQVIKRDAVGNFVRIVGPNAGITAAQQYPSLAGYLHAMAGQTITISGNFVGTGSLPASTYSYTGTFDGAGNIYLSGSLSNPSYSPKTIFVAGGDLIGAQTSGFSGYGIYLQNGPYTLDGAVSWNSGTNRWDYTPGSGATMAIQNDIYGWIYGDLVTGFAYGYWGGKYGNNSAAFNAQPAFKAAQPANHPQPAWGIYEQAIWETSGAYGMSLGERYDAAGQASPDMAVGPNPAIATMSLTMLAHNGCSGSGHGKLRQKLKKNVKLAKKIKRGHWTTVLRKTAHTNARHTAKARVVCKPLRHKAKRHVRYCKVKHNRHGRIKVLVKGKRPVKVKVIFTAAGNHKYDKLHYVKIYRVKR